MRLPATPPIAAPHNGNGRSSGRTTRQRSRIFEPAQLAAEPGCGNGANHPFGTEIAKLKRLAIGTLLSIVRDMITESAPERCRQG